MRTIDLEAIYNEQRQSESNVMSLSDEEIVWLAMKIAIETALDIAIEESDVYYDCINDPHQAVSVEDIIDIKSKIL